MFQKFFVGQSKDFLKVGKLSARTQCHFPENGIFAETKTVSIYYFNQFNIAYIISLVKMFFNGDIFCQNYIFLWLLQKILAA